MQWDAYLYTQLTEQVFPYGDENTAVRLVDHRCIVTTQAERLGEALDEARSQFLVAGDPGSTARSASVRLPDGDWWNLIPSRGYITAPPGGGDTRLPVSSDFLEKHAAGSIGPHLAETPFELLLKRRTTSPDEEE